jgi:transcriptional regulator with XRE-family HTH domain
MSTLQDRLRDAMAANPGVKQTHIAKACGIKPPSVSDWLNGKTKNLDAANLLPTARILGVNPEWLASGKGRMGDPLDWPSIQRQEIDPDLLQSAIVSVKEAIKQAEVQMDVFLVAPVIAFAYRERAKLPQELSQSDFKIFDQMIWAYLQGEIASEGRTGSAVGQSSSSVSTAQPDATKGRPRAQGRLR